MYVFYLQASKVEDLGKVDFESEKEKRNKPIYVPSWFTVDLKTGVSIPCSHRNYDHSLCILIFHTYFVIRDSHVIV